MEQLTINWAAVSVLVVLLANLITLVWTASSVRSEVNVLKRDLKRVENALEKIAAELHQQSESLDTDVRSLLIRVAQLETVSKKFTSRDAR